MYEKATAYRRLLLACLFVTNVFVATAKPIAEEECTSLVQLDTTYTRRTNKTKPKVPQLWPSGLGNKGRYSWSTANGPLDVSKPTWSWHHPKDLWATICVGTSLDEQQNIYLTTEDGIRKFSKDGELIWRYVCNLQNLSNPHGEKHEEVEIISRSAVLMGDNVYGVSKAGRVFALNRTTGMQLWSTQADAAMVDTDHYGVDGTFGHVMADDGVVITSVGISELYNQTSPPCCGPAGQRVVGLDGTNGTVLWEFQPDHPIWNFGVTFAGDGTFIYQTLEGQAHRNWVKNGSLVWKATSGVPESWTDGQANLGANGIVYSVANYGQVYPGTKGVIFASNLSDGTQLWKHDLPKSPNSVPAVGWLHGNKEAKLSVVIPVGQNDFAGARVDVYALDAETGEQQWIFKGPTQTYNHGQGDRPEHSAIRVANHVGGATRPNSWATPVIDARGTVYVGAITGDFFALKDTNGDGDIVGADEVSSFSTDADYVGSSAAAISDGLMAIGDSNSLHVWLYNENGVLPAAPTKTQKKKIAEHLKAPEKI